MLNLNVNILHKFVLIVWGKLSLILQYAMVDLTRDRSLRDQELLWMVFREKQSGLFFKISVDLKCFGIKDLANKCHLQIL